MIIPGKRGAATSRVLARGVVAGGSAALFWTPPLVAAAGPRRPATNARWRSGRLQVAAIGWALVFCACAAAQSSSWVVVRGLAAGSQVEARLASGATVKGKFVAASASGVELRTSPDASRYVPRAQVAKIYLMRKSVADRDAWVGFAVGAAAGSVYGAGVANCYTGPGGNGNPSCPAIQGKGAAAWAAVWGIIGAAVGDAAGGLRRPRTLVYQQDSSRTHRGRKAPKQSKPTASAAPADPVGSAGRRAA